MCHRRALWILGCVSALAPSAAPAFAQPAAYAVPHLFALPTAATTRMMGMGNFVACIKDVGFANPAFAATLTERAAGARLSLIDFSRGLNLRSEQVYATFPLQSEGQGMELTGFRLRTRKPMTLPTDLGPVETSLKEDDAAVHYGRHLGRQWAVGIGLSPILHTDTSLRSAVTGASVTQLHSKAKYGCRLGGIYQFREEGCAGFVYDYYREDVTATGLPFGPGVTGRFTSKEMAVGVSGRMGDKVLAAIEWQQLSTEGEGAKLGDSGFRAGVEVSPTPQWTLRVGDNDGAFSTGLGFQNRVWSFAYAYVKNWNRDSVEDTLGTSKTHSFEARYVW